MTMALRKARIEPQQVDYINAHGTSTPINDPTETLGVKQLFGDHAYKLAMSSTKSMTGHLLGAAGGLEAGITALAVKHQVAPPTINLDDARSSLRPRLRAAHGAADEDPVRAVQLVRIRRHERHAAVEEISRNSGESLASSLDTD